MPHKRPLSTGQKGAGQCLFRAAEWRGEEEGMETLVPADWHRCPLRPETVRKAAAASSPCKPVCPGGWKAETSFWWCDYSPTLWSLLGAVSISIAHLPWRRNPASPTWKPSSSPEPPVSKCMAFRADTPGHLSFRPFCLPCRLGPLVIIGAQIHTRGVLGRGRHGLLLLLTVLFAFLPPSFFLFHRTGGEDCLCFQDVGNVRTLRRSFISTWFHQRAVDVCKELIFSRDWWGGQVSRELLLKENMRKKVWQTLWWIKTAVILAGPKPHGGTKNTYLAPEGEAVTLTTTCIGLHPLHSWALARVGPRSWT